MADFRAFLGSGGYDLLSNPIDLARLAGLWASRRNGNSRCGDTPVSPSTYNQRLAILSSWYTFVRETYHLEVPNPIASVKKRPVQAYAAAVPLAPEAVEDGLEAIDRNTREGLRNYAILAVALFTGHRASELVGLRWQHVKITGKKEQRVTLTFHCKGNKIMRSTLDAEASTVVLEYLYTQYGKNLMQLPIDAPVWVSYSRRNAGQPISAKTLANICEEYLDTSKTHILRHTFAVGVIRSGAPITDLAALLGHTDVKITQIYTKEVMGDENPYGEKLTARFGIRRREDKRKG